MKDNTDPTKKRKPADPLKKQPQQGPNQKDENRQQEPKPEASEDITNTPKKIVNTQDEDVVVNKQDHID